MKRTYFAVCVTAALMQLATPESTNNSVCSDPGVTADPNNKSQFFICAEKHGNAFVAGSVPCPEGYVFSPEAKTCVHVNAIKSHRITRTAKQCETSGPYCDGCDRMVVCALLENRGLTAISNISCSGIDPEMSCSKASCSTDPPVQPCADPSASGFQCLQEGYFPDPANCKGYHFCTKDLVHYAGECETVFDPATGICDPDPAPECKPVTRECKGATLAPASLAPRAPSYYTLCIPKPTTSKKTPYVYAISMMKCPSEHVFDDTKLSCMRSCTGKHGRFADPDNCHGYIECSDSPGQGVKKLCPDKFAFESKRHLCLPENLVETCPKIRSVEVTTISIGQSSSPQTNIENQGFQCQTRGSFADRSDCTRYFECSPEFHSTGVVFRMRRRKCPLFTHFNPEGYCQFGFC